MGAGAPERARAVGGSAGIDQIVDQETPAPCPPPSATMAGATPLSTVSSPWLVWPSAAPWVLLTALAGAVGTALVRVLM